MSVFCKFVVPVCSRVVTLCVCGSVCVLARVCLCYCAVMLFVLFVCSFFVCVFVFLCSCVSMFLCVFVCSFVRSFVCVVPWSLFGLRAFTARRICDI